MSQVTGWRSSRACVLVSSVTGLCYLVSMVSGSLWLGYFSKYTLFRFLAHSLLTLSLFFFGGSSSFLRNVSVWNSILSA